MRLVEVTRSLQIGVLCLALLGSAGLAALVGRSIVAGRKMAHKEAEAALAVRSNDDLRGLVGDLQARLASLTAENTQLRGNLQTVEARLSELDATRSALVAERDEAQGRLHSAEQALGATRTQVAHANNSLTAAKSDLKLTEQQRSGLTARVHELEAQLQAASDRVAELKGNLQVADQKVQNITAQRLALAADRDAAIGRAALLPRQPAAGETASVGTAGGSGTLGAIAAETRHSWGEVTRLLSSAGVDLDQLAARLGAQHEGRGGPFIALGHQAKEVRVAELPPAQAQRLLKTLPLTAPLAHYQLESPFGARIDPINHRASFHPGLDFAAPFKSPVYNTAPGTVIYAGPKGAYGKVVEIDHGSGIVTRYAHLHRILVARGERLSGRQAIGLLGSTGRSTGPHVHYEVLVNGTPQDPEKFLQAGKTIIQVTATR